MSVIGLEKFIYDIIPRGELQIRLLSIFLAANHEDTLHCTLSSKYHYDVDRPSYEALSYT
jgi:hypothetical protein